eukprot:CAMPEP_0175820710 /NCGR_PEP_ID=MMETSP0107_2-20121207/8748_1 /TAXON_ID=195067 ORGANISM="Goniomonas pacifica, Strain CCMP1869" /NCGR_SAMPLE_ID=MMETSP0107_2 /ASSEMBLY_ACC=CAM_ASM_000203 /LENGTH=85 /DNA_ID=CAMNT_0017133043 /DNA_START=309 /DNA_END=566 /DNA_ORIENTATION=-
MTEMDVSVCVLWRTWRSAISCVDAPRDNATPRCQGHTNTSDIPPATTPPPRHVESPKAAYVVEMMLQRVCQPATSDASVALMSSR